LVEVIAVNISPDMGERIVISGLRDSILEVFPEIGEKKGRGGHRHLQIGRMLDIDLISELPPPAHPRCMYPKCGNLWPEGAGSDS
jgi:hypothetical protein